MQLQIMCQCRDQAVSNTPPTFMATFIHLQSGFTAPIDQLQKGEFT
jgi:hypothetical protein